MSLDPELLKKVTLFCGLDDKEAKKLAPLFKERQFSAGEAMAEEGKHGIGFFVIESGTAKVTVHGEERTTLGPGSYFGEVALIDDGPRTATVTAESDVKAHVLVA
jgi:CRP/FNR family transcriptional regulator, cyclic AMP receptor protein